MISSLRNIARVINGCWCVGQKHTCGANMVANLIKSIWHPQTWCRVKVLWFTFFTAIHGQEPRKQNWPRSLGGRDGIFPLYSITATTANHGCLWAHICRRGKMALFSKSVMLLYDAVWALFKKRCSWLASCISEEAHVMLCSRQLVIPHLQLVKKKYRKCPSTWNF